MDTKVELERMMRAAEEMIARGEDASDLLQRIDRDLDRMEIEAARAEALVSVREKDLAEVNRLAEPPEYRAPRAAS